MWLLSGGEVFALVRDGCTLASSSVSDDDEVVTWGVRVGRVGKVRGEREREVEVVVRGKVDDVGDMPGVLRRRYTDMGVLTARSGVESYTSIERLCLDQGGREAAVDEERDWIDKRLNMTTWERNGPTHAYRLERR